LDAVLLAAGYATRLYPLTKDRPKPLLPVGGRPIIDYLVDELEAAPEVQLMVLVTNARFQGAFEGWAAARTFRVPLEIISDGSTSNETRLGAIADLHLAIRRAGTGGAAVYVLATDNLPRLELNGIIRLWQERGASAAFAFPCADPARLARAGVAVLDNDGRIIEFEEKSQRPRTNLLVPPFYVYTTEAIAMLPAYLEEGNSPDAPGHFLSWLVRRQPVYALVTAEGTYDIGTIESYRAVCEAFGRRT
jgi:glucose-1-phosphate thymidylyltransferase